MIFNTNAYLSDRYRPDIDGLRALAVLVILFFHAGIDGFRGGFAGVDIFFVISGFLITRNIVRDVENGKFSFVRFYMKRARRLLPALLFTLLLSFFLGAILLSPQHMQRMSGALSSMLAFSSNFYFWHEAGYFDAEAHFKPLLHTWSLAIEEQFYLLWPAFVVLLLFLTRKDKNSSGILQALVSIGTLSLISSQYMLDIDRFAAFYLLPFRVFEFVIGALCVWLIKFQPKNNIILELLFFAGLWLALYPVFTFRVSTPFPGINALYPCIGAALMIYGGTARYSPALLRNKIMVGIGLISYSLYMIHWPLIVYYRYWTFDSLNDIEQIVLVLASVAAAIPMYFFIEQPFRLKTKEEKRNLKRFLPACTAITALLFIPAFHAYKGDGWGWRVPDDLRMATTNIDHLREKTEGYFEQTVGEDYFRHNKARAVIIGASFAQDMRNAIEQNNPHHHIKWLRYTSDCQPYIGQRPLGVSKHLLTQKDSDRCNETFRQILKSGDFRNAEIVIFAPYWLPFGIEGFGQSLDEIKSYTKGKIIAFGPRMSFQNMPRLAVRYGRLLGLEDYVNSRQNRKPSLHNQKLMKNVMQNYKDVIYVDVIDIFCPGLQCPVLSENGHITHYDDHHWTLEGAAMFGAALKNSGHEVAPLLFE